MSDISPLISAEHALQEAIFATLANDSALNEALGGAKIFDRAPEDAAFPYIAFANLTTRDGATASESGYECRVSLNVWSRYEGKQEVFAILHLVRRLLHDRQLPVSAHVLVNLREEFADVAQDRDRLTYRGLIRFRAFLETIN